ncbi:MAG: hypothetical protein KDK36_03570 [Leptospiraceae bacterium]|nr:hypothetical protein [Leptospiraceae bacterium]
MIRKLGILIILFSIGCNSAYEYRVVRKKKSNGTPTATREAKPQETAPAPVQVDPDALYTYKSLEEWNKVKEGFLNTATFQVKVTSLKSDRDAALAEANEVAKRKAVKLLIAEGVDFMSPESKVDIKILVEESGKMIADSEKLEERFYFVFQVKRPALEIIIKEKLK